MSDTKPAVAEAVASPAEGIKSAEPVKLQSGSKPVNADTAEVAETETSDVKANDKPATDEKTTAEVKSEESSAVKSEENADEKSDEKRTSDKKDYRNGGKSDRSNYRSGRYNDKNSHYHKKSKPTDEFDDLPVTDDPVEIREQVEFYFSVQNLSTDKHMFLELQGPKNRPVSIKHMTTFKRMKRFQPYSAVVAALRESKVVDVLDDGEYSGTGNEAIKRKVPLVVPRFAKDDEREPSTLELFERMHRASASRGALDASIYVKGFGDEEKADQIAIEKFFKPYGAVMVRKRRDADNENKWKGSVFVEFETVEAQQEFLALDPKPKFNGNELTIMGKRQYSEMKCKEKGITPGWELPEGGRREHKNDGNDRRGGFRGGRGGRGGRGDRGGRGGRGNGRGRGRYNDHHSDRRDRDRSRSPREGSDDWNGRRDKFQKSRDFKDDRRDNDKSSDSKCNIKRDKDGVPIVQDTRGQPDPSPRSNKRKADDANGESSLKKNKIEIKEDA